MPLFFLKSISLPHKKSTAKLPAVKMPSPKSVILPLSMHIGAIAVPSVKPGDEVKVGQMIAEAGGYVSAPIFASVSGKIKSVDTTVLSNGKKIPAVVIESDGLDTPADVEAPANVTNTDELVKALGQSGIVGLGGAGFPTSVKFNVTGKKVHAVIVNGAECEPYITSDTRTMFDRTDDIEYAISVINECIEPEKIIFGIEKNKLGCIRKIRSMTENIENACVVTLRSSYPQGAEKVLIYHTTDRVVPEGKLPIDVGVIVVNCTTLAEIGRYLKTGMPLTHKCVTIDGSAVAEPKNVIAPIGTPIKDIIEFFGGLKVPAKKVLLGGPMMGWPVESMEFPIMKNTNAVLFFDEKDATPPEESSCIKCASCANACPMGLDPKAFNLAMNANDDEALVELKANLCMECGCCAYVCPAKLQLVQTNKIAKAKANELIKLKKEEKK